MAESGAGKKSGALESLSKEELIGKCKTLLQIAQKAKKAKDDAHKQNEGLQTDSEKEKKNLLEQISLLESNIDDKEDVVKAKQRQLDRLSEENDSLLEQMDTYCSQLRVVTKEKAEMEKAFGVAKDALVKSEKQASKAMEHEASMICLKERGAEMANKLKMAEQELAAEKIMGNDKNCQLKTLTEKLKLAEATAQIKIEQDIKQASVRNDNELKRMEKLIEENDTNMKQLESAKNQLEKENVEFEQKNSGLIEELNQFNQEMKKRGERIEKLEKINTEQLRKIRNSEKLNNENSSQLEVVKDIKHQKEEVKRLLDLTVTEKENLTDEILKYKNENDTLNDREKVLKNQLDEYTSEKEMLAQNVSELTIEMVKLKETLIDEEKLFSCKIQEVEKNLAAKEEQVNLLQKEKTNTEISKEGFEMINLALKEAKSTSESLINEKNEISNKHSAIDLDFKDKCKEIETLNVKVDGFESQLKASHDSLRLKENEVTELNELNNSLTKLIESSDNSKCDKRTANEQLELKLQETVNRSLKFSGEVEALKFKLEETNDLNEKLKTEIQKCKEGEEQIEERHTADTDKCNTKIKLANKNIANLENENKDLQANIVKLETVEAKYESTIEELKEMKQQVTTYQHDLDDENTKNASLTKDKELLERSLASLQSQLDASKSELSKITKKIALLETDDSRSEAMSTSTVSRVEESNRMRDVEDSFEDRYSKLKLIAIKLKKKAVDQEKIIKDLQSRNSKASKTEEGDSGIKEKITSLTKNFNNLQSQYDSAVDKLENIEAEAKTLKKDLEASLSECLASKQKSEESIQQALSAKTELTKMEDKAREASGKVHSLEITIEEERKERKLLESNAIRTGEQASQLRDVMGEKMLIEDTVQSLKLQVVQLEETLSREQERADHAHKNLTSTRAQLTQAEADLARQKIETVELNKKYEDTVRATEVLQEQVGDVIKNSEKEQGQEKNKVFQLERQVSALEANLAAKSQSLNFKDNEFTKVSKEFENYKLRAQSVLKQSKDKTFEEESKKKQEDMFALEKMNDALNDKMKTMSLEIRTISMERNGLQDEHDRLMERFSLLLQELGTKEKNWREKADQQDVKIRQIDDDKTGNLERVHKTMENLKQIHQQEVETMKSTTLAELSKIKQQIDLKENEVIRLELILQSEQEARRQAEETAGRSVGAVGVFDNRLDICQIEREACEGQEVDASNGPSPNTSLASPVPLEQLLAQDLIPEELRSTSSSRAGGADRQVSHLAALLSESEAQNSRLEKLTDVLKEEIRIYQRSEERHSHIEHLEYVKNVILKFLTLTGAQERVRLIPVLQTILKLKKEEVAKIEELVRADESSQAGGEGWGSYLHLWSTAP